MSEVEMGLPEKPVFTPNTDMYGIHAYIPSKDGLKPCPFCGSKAELLTMSYSGGKVYGVFCIADRGCEEQHGHFIDNYRTPEEAVAAWNMRASSSIYVYPTVPVQKVDVVYDEELGALAGQNSPRVRVRKVSCLRMVDVLKEEKL